MEAFLGGLALMVVSGLTWLAYRHPAGFEKISKPLQLLILFGFMITMAYDIGAGRARLALIGFIEPGSLGKASEAAEAISPDMLWVFAGVAASLAYLLFLGALPYLIGDPKQDRIESERDKPDEH